MTPAETEALLADWLTLPDDVQSNVVAGGPDGDCIVWQGPWFDNGYAMREGQRYHREVYRTLVGPIPDGHVVRHRCDNRPCIRPAHLTTGTQADNMRDMLARGRAAWQRTERTAP